MKFKACICGWFDGGYPDDVMFAGVGGILDCPACREHKRNRNLEMQYGNIEVVNHVELFRLTYAPNWYDEFKKIQDEHFMNERIEFEKVKIDKIAQDAYKEKLKHFRNT